MGDMDMEDQFGPDAIYEFGPMQHLEYHQVLFFRQDYELSWLSMSDSFYQTSKHLVAEVLCLGHVLYRDLLIVKKVLELTETL